MNSALFHAEENGEALVVRFTCVEFDHDKTQQLKTDFNTAFGKWPQRSCVVDISAVDFMPSPTLGALVEAHLALKKSDCRMIVAGPKPHISKLFTLAGLDKLLAISENVDSALTEMKN